MFHPSEVIITSKSFDDEDAALQQRQGSGDGGHSSIASTSNNNKERFLTPTTPGISTPTHTTMNRQRASTWSSSMSPAMISSPVTNNSKKMLNRTSIFQKSYDTANAASNRHHHNHVKNRFRTFSNQTHGNSNNRVNSYSSTSSSSKTDQMTNTVSDAAVTTARMITPTTSGNPNALTAAFNMNEEGISRIEEEMFLLNQNAAGYPHNLSPSNSETSLNDRKNNDLDETATGSIISKNEHLAVGPISSLSVSKTNYNSKNNKNIFTSPNTPRHTNLSSSLLSRPSTLSNHKRAVSFPMEIESPSSLTKNTKKFDFINIDDSIRSNKDFRNTDTKRVGGYDGDRDDDYDNININLYPPNFNNIATGSGGNAIDMSNFVLQVQHDQLGGSNTFTADETDDDIASDDKSSIDSFGRSRKNTTYHCGDSSSAKDDGKMKQQQVQQQQLEEHGIENIEIDEFGNIFQCNSTVGGSGEEDDNMNLVSPSLKNMYHSSNSHIYKNNYSRRRYSNELLLKTNGSNEFDPENFIDGNSGSNADGFPIMSYSNSNDVSVGVGDGGHKSHHHHNEISHHLSGKKTILRTKTEKGTIQSFIECTCQKLCPTNVRINWSRISSFVVRYAPCFFCAGRLETSATDRMLLMRLNVLCAIFSLCQFAVGVFIMIVFLSDLVVDRGVLEGGGSFVNEALTPNLWTMGGCLLLLSIVGLFIFCTMVITIPKIKLVNLDAAIRFMWILYWVLPLEILFVIALFDYHRVTDVWIRHWWISPSMAWFRQVCCEPGTANTKCAVPLYGGAEFLTNEEWCMHHYDGATDCGKIREEAVDCVQSMSYFFIYSNSIMGAVLIILLLLSLGLLEGIISPNLVQRSKESNISLWLTLPIVGCFAGGSALLFAPQSLISNGTGYNGLFWIGLCYIVTGFFFAISALLGWFISAKTVLNLRDKMHKEIAVYLFIIMLILTIFAVGSIFSVSLVYTLNVVDVFDEENRATIACYIDAANSCTCCDDDPLTEVCQGAEKCPEWKSIDVSKIYQTQLKQSATLAAIFFLYAFSALRFGFSLRSSVSKYEIDYV